MAMVVTNMGLFSTLINVDTIPSARACLLVKPIVIITELNCFYARNNGIHNEI